MTGTALSLVFRLFFDRMRDHAVKVKSRQLLQRPNAPQKAELEVNGQIVPETKVKSTFMNPINVL